MLAVQLFEHHLANIWLWHLHKGDAELTERNMRRMLRRAIHASHKASASELRRGLEDALEPELLEEIARAISWRNYLAHQFLRERLRSQPMSHFVAGSTEVLTDMQDWFTDLTLRLEGLMNLYAASVAAEVEQAPEELKAASIALGWRLWRGDYPDDPPRPHPPGT